MTEVVVGVILWSVYLVLGIADSASANQWLPLFVGMFAGVMGAGWIYRRYLP